MSSVGGWFSSTPDNESSGWLTRRNSLRRSAQLLAPTIALVSAISILIAIADRLELAFALALGPMLSWLAWLALTRLRAMSVGGTGLIGMLWLVVMATSFDWGVRASADLLSTLAHPAGLLRVGTVVLLAAYSFLKIAKSGVPRIAYSAPVGLYLAYLASALFISPASLSPTYSLYKTFEVLSALMFLVVVADSRHDLLRAVWSITLSSLLIVMAVVTAYSALNFDDVVRSAYYSGLASGLRWEPPILVTANGLGAIGAMLAGASLVRAVLTTKLTRKLVLSCISVVSTITVVLSQSRTALAAIVLFLLFAAVALRSLRRVVVPVIVVLAVVAAASPAARDGIGQMLLRNMTPVQLSELSGRAETWRTLLDAVAASPLVGFGFSVGARSLVEGSSLNGYLEVLLGVGLVGFTPFLLSITLTCAWLIRLVARDAVPRSVHQRRLVLEVVPVFTVVLMRTVTSVGAGGWFTPDLLIFLLILVIVAHMSHAESPNSSSRLTP